MHQFTVEPIAKLFAAGGNEVWLTTRAVWMGAAAIILWLFMLGGLKRQLVPGRWQMAVEGFTGFVSSLMATNIGPEGRKYKIGRAPCRESVGTDVYISVVAVPLKKQ